MEITPWTRKDNGSYGGRKGSFSANITSRAASQRAALARNSSTAKSLRNPHLLECAVLCVDCPRASRVGIRKTGATDAGRFASARLLQPRSPPLDDEDSVFPEPEVQGSCPKRPLRQPWQATWRFALTHGDSPTFSEAISPQTLKPSLSAGNRSGVS